LTKILLIGCGDAHLSILRRLLNENIKNYEVTLISPSKEGVQFNLDSLSEKESFSFIEDTIISFDPLQKMLLSFSGEIYRFDVISFDLNMKFSLFKQALVPIAEDGTMLVEDTLQNEEFPFLFGAGECVSIKGLPSGSKFTDMQGDVLWNNIKRYISGQKLQSLSSKSTKGPLNGLLNRIFKRF
jgi:NADH dehydrogenase FAD-containing subunit